MKASTTRWSLALATAALLAVPVAGFAQTTTPPQTPTQATPTANQPSAEAQQHLRQARAALDDVKTANLSVQARNHVNELNRRLSALERAAGINDKAGATGRANRNPDSTANRGNTKWDTEVAAIDKTLTTLLGPATTTGATDPTATGTTGKAAAAIKIDEASRTKLMEVRTHITAFAAAMGSGKTSDAPSDPASASAATSSTTGTSASGTTTTGSTTAATGTGSTMTTQPPAQTPPAQAQTQTQAEIDEEAARKHLTEARNSLSALTQLPAAGQLTGEARNHVSQLISNFNELITTQSEWRAAYTKVEANLTALLGPESEAAAATSATGSTGTGTTGTVGTSGEAAVNLDPALREKLVELRRHLNAFEKAAGGMSGTASTSTEPTTGATSTTGGTAATGTTTSGTTTGTTGTTSSTTATTEPQTTGSAAAQSSSADLMQHVAAIERLLAMQDESGGLTLTKAQVEELRKHWAALRQSIEKR